MKKITLSLAAIVACTLAVGVTLHATSSDNAAYPTAPTEDIKSAADANNAFAMSLYGRLASGSGNFLFSPYSIDSALGMAYAGARGNTAAQMKQTLDFSLPDARLHPAIGALAGKLAEESQGNGNPLFSLNVGDAVWLQQGFHFDPTYLNLLRSDYAAELHQSDFVGNSNQACNDINQWVAGKTSNMIPVIVQPQNLDPLTRMVLVNAIYFKGNWETQFEKGQTSDQAFHLDSSHDVSSPMMFENISCAAGGDDSTQIAELPYKGEKLSMIVLLPRAADGLPALEKNLSAQYLNQLIATMQRQEVNVHLPKFKLSSAFGLASVLGAMGMPDAFDRSAADFSGITSDERLYINSVIHLAKIDVNEEGTEAAAATAVIMGDAVAISVRSLPLEFRADHPFLFMIRQNSTGAILFIGRMTNPAAPS